MSTPAQNASLPDLVRNLAEDARELVQAEVGLAKDELKKTARVMLIAIAGATAVTTIAVLAMCVFIGVGVLALGGSHIAALSAGAGWAALLVLAAVIVSLRLLSRGQGAQAAQAASPTREPDGITNRQNEVM